jgi:Holliday junction resolvasome RuvABC endonuclease subunit
MRRVLAIDPTSRGFGFAVLEGPHELIDWGLKATDVRARDANRWCLRQIVDLTRLYEPETFVVEDAAARGARRGQRVTRLMRTACMVVRQNGVKVRSIARKNVARSVMHERALTKYKVAAAIADRFPELAPRLPPVRKPWMSADARMAIFTAVALAVAAYASRQNRQTALAQDNSDGRSVSALNGGETAPSIMSRR